MYKIWNSWGEYSENVAFVVVYLKPGRYWKSEDENGYCSNGFLEEEKYLFILSMCISQKYVTLQLVNSN